MAKFIPDPAHTCRSDEIFVFGSNTAGRHGAGAALTAVKLYGAIEGRAFGLQGRSYGIPTREFRLGKLYTLPISHIERYVSQFVAEARFKYPRTKFFLTAIGTGLAGYSDEAISRCFEQVPKTVRVPPHWEHLIQRED